MGNNNKSSFLKWPITILKILRLYSPHGDRKIIMIQSIYIVLLTFIMCMELMQFLHFNSDVNEFVTLLEGVVAMVHFIGKILVISLEQKQISNLTKLTNLCWDISKYSTPIQSDLQKIISKSMRLQQLYFVSMCVTDMLIILSPLFGNDLPLGIWTLEKYRKLYLLTCITEVLILPSAASTVFACDSIFLTCCVEIVVQCRLLCYCVKQHDMAVFSKTKASLRRKFKDYIRHHIFILKFIKTLQSAFSAILLVQYSTLTLILCVQMYALFDSADLGSMIIYTQRCFTAAATLAIYSIPADIVISEAEKVGYAIYDSNWSSHCVPGLCCPIRFMIQKSVNGSKFTAGNIFEVDTTTMLRVLKVSWSACTLMRALRRNQ